MVERESERDRGWSMTQALCEGLNECVVAHQESVKKMGERGGGGEGIRGRVGVEEMGQW